MRSLLSRGAYAIVATLTRVDARIASMLVGRLLADVYQPLPQTRERTLLDIFFNTQITTALMYDPLLPLMCRAVEKNTKHRRETRLHVWGTNSVAQWSPVDPKTYHEEVAIKQTELLVKYDLYDVHRNLAEAGHVRPETLMFSICGSPDLVTIAP